MIRTERLVLRDWRDEDLAAYAELNADPRVMEYFPSTLTRADSDAQAARIRAHIQERGFGFWAVEIPGVVEFAGFLGLAVPGFEAPFMPAVEIGWRLSHAAWGKGYATEGARGALRHAFDQLGLSEVVSFTTVGNARSRRVMEKAGMTHDASGDFDHPRIAEGHPLRRHVLYRKRR